MAGPREKVPAFAIVRLDDSIDENAVTVTKVLLTEAAAMSEVARLNASRRDDTYRYVWQATRQASVDTAE